MLSYLTPPKPNPTGSQLVRLDTVPLKDRQAALHKLMSQGAITAEECESLLDLVVDPGDHSTRIAA